MSTKPGEVHLRVYCVVSDFIACEHSLALLVVFALTPLSFAGAKLKGTLRPP